MQKINSFAARTVGTLMLLIAFAPTMLSAQSLWLDRSQDKTLTFEFLKPDFDGEDQLSFTSAAYFLTLRLKSSAATHFIAELPFAHAGFEDDRSFLGLDLSGSTIGNPYIGIEYRESGSPVFGELGVRLPLTSDEKFGAVLIGTATDIDRLEAFLPDILSITGMANIHQATNSGFAVRFRVGPSLLINTNGGGDTELLIGYSAHTGFESERFSVFAGLTGRANLTQEEADFGERSLHQLGFAASLVLGQVRPGVQVRLPLDEDLRETLNYVIGVSLGFRLN